VSVEDFIQENFGDLLSWAIVLRGFRNREGLSQRSLGELIGVSQTNISQMELGKRPIGKILAKRFTNFFKTDYRLFL
jgi:transcriptional regulator with XRE-family HTH domain